MMSLKKKKLIERMGMTMMISQIMMKKLTREENLNPKKKILKTLLKTMKRTSDKR